MSKSYSSELIPIGHLDSETYEIINLINTYDLPGDFFSWISGGNFTTKVLKEETLAGTYKRISQYYIDDAIVFTGNGEFDLNKLSKEAIQVLTSSFSPIKRNTPGFDLINRRIVTQTSTELHYTVIANLYENDLLVGYAWEIYELKKLIQFYEKINDPLRYWRKG